MGAQLENTLIGIGATVVKGAVLGKNCIIGARALVKERMVVPDGSVVMGIPGRVVKQVKPSGFGISIEGLKRNGDLYVANAKRFMVGCEQSEYEKCLDFEDMNALCVLYYKMCKIECTRHSWFGFSSGIREVLLQNLFINSSTQPQFNYKFYRLMSSVLLIQ